jgi:hypothetical protein
MPTGSHPALAGAAAADGRALRAQAGGTGSRIGRGPCSEGVLS